MRRMADLLAERVAVRHRDALADPDGLSRGDHLRARTGGLERVAYDDLDHVRLTRSFLEDPQRFLRHLFDDD